MNNNELSSIDDIKDFIFAQQEITKSDGIDYTTIFTVHNENNDHHFTYKLVQAQKPKKNVWWVYVLVMAENDNRDSYKFLGAISPDRGYHYSPNAQIKENSPSNKAFKWFAASIENEKNRTEYPFVKFYKAGKCSNCGHLLTVPLSIKRMMGDCCFEKTVGSKPKKQQYNNQSSQQKLDFLE